MDLLKIAKVFGMDVTKFTETTGYSRQGLHQIFNKETKVRPRRWNAMIKNLELYTEEQYKREIEAAALNWEKRKDQIKELESYLAG